MKRAHIKVTIRRILGLAATYEIEAIHGAASLQLTFRYTKLTPEQSKHVYLVGNRVSQDIADAFGCDFNLITLAPR